MSEIFGHPLNLSVLSEEPAETPTWKRNLQKAMKESDVEKLLQLVHETELALYYRWQELGAEGQPEERHAMSAAVNDLWAIKVHKLGWPAGLQEKKG